MKKYIHFIIALITITTGQLQAQDNNSVCRIYLFLLKMQK